VLWVVLIGIVTGAVVRYEFEISHEVVDVLDWTTNQTITRVGSFINHQMPGPTVECMLGDELEITIYNKMPTSGTTIHFHGQHQKHTHFYDGVHGLSQCDIPPSSSFTYKFKAEPAGTHMYHSHLPYQYGDGIFGGMIVHDPQDPFRDMYSEELLIGLNDWPLSISDETFQLVAKSRFDKWPLAYATSFINGKDQNNPEIFSISQGSTYRLRFYQIGTEYSHRVQLANHRFTVISVDGSYVQPTEVDFIQLHPGYRVDALVTFDQPPSTYELRALVFDYTNSETEYYTSALFQYPGASLSNPVRALGVMDGDDFDQNQFVLLDEFSLHPYRSNGGNFHSSYDRVPSDRFSKPEEFFTTSYSAKDYSGSDFIDSWNNEVFKPPRIPLVFTKGTHGLAEPRVIDIISYDGTYSSQAVAETFTRNLKHNQVVDIVFQNSITNENPASFVDAMHPNHLHGHYFWVLGKGSGTFDLNTDSNSLNFDDPVQRDTIRVVAGSWVAIRFVANNPGAWIMHCHLETHAVFGMAVVWLSDVDHWPELPEDFPVCGQVDRLPPSDFSPESSSASITTIPLLLIIITLLCFQ